MKAVWFGLVLSAISAAGKMSHGKQGHKATIECGVATYRDTVAWYHGTKLIIRERNKGPPLRGDSEILSRAAVRRMTNLEISKLKDTDAGQFKCEIDGKNYEHVLLVVSVSMAPWRTLQKGEKATLQCKVAGPAPDLTVQWKRPDGSAAPGSHTVTLQAAALSDAGKWACVFSYSGKEFNETLDVAVKEFATTPQPRQSPGSIPKSPCATCSNVSPFSDTPTSTPLFPWWVWAVASVGCLVVVLLLVLIIVLAQRIRRRKRRFLKKQARQMAPRQYCQCARPAAAAKPQKGRRRERPAALPAQPLLME